MYRNLRKHNTWAKLTCCYFGAPVHTLLFVCQGGEGTDGFLFSPGTATESQALLPLCQCASIYITKGQRG